MEYDDPHRITDRRDDLESLKALESPLALAGAEAYRGGPLQGAQVV